jgi:ribosomal protein S18 acetylase RimI-like enzyme
LATGSLLQSPISRAPQALADSATLTAAFPSGMIEIMNVEEVVVMTTRQGEALTARRLRTADRPALRQFGNSLSPATTAKFLPHAYDDATLEPILNRSEAGDDLTLGVFRGPLMVAYFFLWYLQQPFPMLGVGLHDEVQGTGLGRQMLNLLIIEARQHGNDGIDLTTLPANERAFRLYLSVGFRHIGFVENPRADGGVTVERVLRFTIHPAAAEPDRLANGRPVLRRLGGTA